MRRLHATVKTPRNRGRREGGHGDRVPSRAAHLLCDSVPTGSPAPGPQKTPVLIGGQALGSPVGAAGQLSLGSDGSGWDAVDELAVLQACEATLGRLRSDRGRLRTTAHRCPDGRDREDDRDDSRGLHVTENVLFTRRQAGFPCFNSPWVVTNRLSCEGGALPLIMPITGPREAYDYRVRNPRVPGKP